ncbi:hypothetical protein NDU88_002697 [Pleurodeles waltl]|uniref:Uncharacterized protein n=1 Tax=Pleurodeles waltl TaxID=8319 RepID=A0AAV7KWD6_PLEWA|nr:hypothetical protein NDU88_002697 [Pleurodeles waltl]
MGAPEAGSLISDKIEPGICVRQDGLKGQGNLPTVAGLKLRNRQGALVPQQGQSKDSVAMDIQNSDTHQQESADSGSASDLEKAGFDGDRMGEAETGRAKLMDSRRRMLPEPDIELREYSGEAARADNAVAGITKAFTTQQTEDLVTYIFAQGKLDPALTLREEKMLWDPEGLKITPTDSIPCSQKTPSFFLPSNSQACEDCVQGA